MKHILFDSHAVLRWVQKEKGYQKVRSLLTELIWEAAEIKARHPISYADCFAAATAVRFQASILTGDPEFKKLGDLVQVEWL